MKLFKSSILLKSLLVASVIIFMKNTAATAMIITNGLTVDQAYNDPNWTNDYYQFTTIAPSQTNLTGSFFDGGSGWGGKVKMTVSITTDATPDVINNLPLGNGPSFIGSPDLQQVFESYFGNPLPSNGFAYNYPADYWSSFSSGIHLPFTQTLNLGMDFTDLEYGYLPKGTIFYTRDLDVVGKEYFSISANSVLNSNSHWLDQGEFYGNIIGGGSGVFPSVTYDNSNNSYLIAAAGRQSESVALWRTTQDLYDLSINATRVGGGSHFYEYAFRAPNTQNTVVPEPGTISLMSLGILGGFFIKKRKNQKITGNQGQTLV
ncbi:MAG: PEP-CTERM sorting domain-containing protein [Candidatus Moranbacteria bacterium]|nr:PEP-CTERM sorting domain-containing protein [Candidatus Moranbacteria bacterium]